MNAFPSDPAHRAEPAQAAIYARGAAEFLGVVPYALGYHPAEGDVLVAGLSGSRLAALGCARLDQDLNEIAADLLAALHQVPAIDSIAIAGYAGPDATSAISELALILRAAGNRLSHVLRVHQQRLYCLSCDCLGAHGVTFDPAATSTAAHATVAGRMAFPSRQAMLDQLAPHPEATAATEAALNTAADRLLADPPDDDQATAFIDHVLRRAHTGERIDDDTAATLILLLMDPGWRDHAWLATADQPWLAALWLDLVRRCPREESFAAVPVLAGWSAWRSGNGALARAAVGIALGLDPGYRFAALLRDVLDAAIPPSRMPWPPPADEMHRYAATTRQAADEPGR